MTLDRVLIDILKEVTPLISISLKRVQVSLLKAFVKSLYGAELQNIYICNFNNSAKTILKIHNKTFVFKTRQQYADMYIDINDLFTFYQSSDYDSIPIKEIIYFVNSSKALSKINSDVISSKDFFCPEKMINIDSDMFKQFVEVYGEYLQNNDPNGDFTNSLYTFYYYIRIGIPHKILTKEYYKAIELRKEEGEEEDFDGEFLIEDFDLEYAYTLLKVAADTYIISKELYVIKLKKYNAPQSRRILNNVKHEPYTISFETVSDGMNEIFKNRSKIKEYNSYSIECTLYRIGTFGAEVLVQKDTYVLNDLFNEDIKMPDVVYSNLKNIYGFLIEAMGGQ